MADEGSLRIILTAPGLVGDPTFVNETITFDISGTDYQHGTQNIGTSEEALSLGSCATCGLLYIRNNDSTNFVTFRKATAGDDAVKIKAGEHVVIYCNGNAPFLIADTAAVDISYTLFEV